MMEHTSTPVCIYKKIKSYSSSPNSKVQNENVDSTIQNSTDFFFNITPVPEKIKTPRKNMSDLENNKLTKMCDIKDTCSDAADNDGTVDVDVNENVDSRIQNSTESYFIIPPNITPIKKASPQKKIASPENECISSDTHDDPKDIVSTCNDLFCSEWSIKSTELDYSFADNNNISIITETLSEMRQAVPMYLNKLKDLNLTAEWDLSGTPAAGKSIYKSTHGLKGPLEPEEVSFIKKRLKQFCKEYKININSVRLCLSDKITKFRFPNEIRLKFIQYLCTDVVCDRNPVTIYRAISKLGLRKGRFTEQDDDLLIEMYHNYSGSQLHSVCGLLLNRHRSHILKRFKRLGKQNLLGLRPTPLIGKKKPLKLQKLILNNILIRKDYDCSRLMYRINSNTWKAIGRDCGISPALAKAIFICDIKPQIFAKHPIKFNEFVKTLLYRIYRSTRSRKWKTWEEVEWKNLSNSLYGIEPFSIYATLRKIAMKYVPKEKWENFRECAKHLYDNALPQLENFEPENNEEEIKLNQIIIRK